MKLAIMQPYLFPYIGYYQLVNAADIFIFYDDVNYIKNGWINRNRISISGQAHYFTVPVSQASSFKKINEIKIESGQTGQVEREIFENIKSELQKMSLLQKIFWVY